MAWPVAAIVVGVVWTAGWATGLLNALTVLDGRFDPAPVTSAAVAAGATVRDAASALAVLALAVLGARAVGVSPVDLGLRRPADRRRHTRAVSGLGQLGAAAAFVLGYGLLVAVDAALPTRGYPFPSGRWAVLPALVHAVLAGPTEELALVALPTVLFRRAGLPWPAVGLIALALRVPFHLYYGWGTLGVASWAVVVWAWYARTGRLWGPIVAHSAIDLIGVTVALGGPHRAGLVSAELATATLTAVGLTGLWARQLRNGRPYPGPTRFGPSALVGRGVGSRP